MKGKTQAGKTSEARRKSIAEDLDVFLKAGHKIECIPDGVSGQDPSGPGKPLTPGSANK